MSPPRAAARNRPVSSSPSAREVSNLGRPSSIRRRERAKICRQAASVFPVTSAISGYP